MTISQIDSFGKDKLLLTLDEDISFPLYQKEVQHLQLEQGAELMEVQYHKIREEILIPRARKRTMYLLEKMDRTEAGLREKLRQGRYPEDIVEDAVAYVKSYHYVDDLRYALSYVRCHGQNKSRRLLYQELSGKGVSRDLIEQALEEAYEDGDESAKIARWLDKKHYSAEEANPKEKQRMYQFLLRKGFRSGDIWKLL